MIEPESSQPLIKLRQSPIEGVGVFAWRLISRGTRIIEYVGERISHAEADERYDEDAMAYPKTFLFTLDRQTVIDATVQGNESRFINHSCAPNCQAIIENGRIFIEALTDIPAGTELTFDYHLEYSGRYRAEWRERYACRCGSRSCRGTMLLPKKRRSRRRRAVAR